MTWDDRLTAITCVAGWFALSWAFLSWATRHQ